MEDDGQAISYKLLARGMPVHASDGDRLGTVDGVLDNEREHIFDGIVMATDRGLLFVDAPEVARITDQGVTLAIDAAEAQRLTQYRPGAPEYRADPRTGRLGRLLGRGWKRR